MALAWQPYPGEATGFVGDVHVPRRRRDPSVRRRFKSAAFPDPVRDLQDAQQYTALMLARTAESKDPTMGSHVERIYGYTLLLARGLGLGEERAVEIAEASMLHDVGKLVIPERILEKAGPLTPEEFRVIQRHPLEGVQILGTSPVFDFARDIVHWHHERWDGSGYPDGLQGKEIPIPAAIVAVADVYDALTSRRAYKDPWNPEKAIAELEAVAGVLLYPEGVEVFVGLWRKGALAQVAPKGDLKAG